MTVDDLNTAVLLGALVLVAAVFAVRLSVGTGTPSLLLYLALGVAIGEDGLGIQFDDYDLTQVLGYAALVLILAEGGLTTRWSSIRGAIAPAALLATLGTVISIVVIGTVAHLLLDVGWATGMLLGAVVSSTDAAAVFSVLRRAPLPSRLGGLLEAESGFNDAPVVIAVVSLTTVLGGGGGEHSWWFLGVEAAGELLGGAAIGLALGVLGAMGLRRVALPASGLYPITVLGVCALAYGLSAELHTSGFIAVYLAGLVLGNAELPHRPATRGFAEGVGWLAQIGLFVLLGLLVSPQDIPSQVVPALVVGFALLLVARPLSVLLSVSWFRVPLRDQVILSWGGLRGAVPIVLATVPAAAGVPGTEGVVEMVFVLVVAFTLVQAPTLPWLARRLGISEPAVRDLEVESSPLEEIGADVLQVKVGPTSHLHGLEVFELRLPEGAEVSLVVRDGRARVPDRSTTLRHGDDLLVVAVAGVREATEDRLHALSQRGRLAGWTTPGATRLPELRPAPGRDRNGLQHQPPR
ncbi:potassium/proton antiporter [Quadrisphaera sp. INWT6]|uniref:potassium/proton antiporter n=1 Tax=Quadrisphaera sp. INWT6 TaxID=2596917 RepID=UPI001891F5B1|nr:potassium/proton antiporter [Quadrisphaera sp. INWT6]MBF5080249.1 potassium/proton antiporter [Quadrisphaera sp. INWT6]